MKKLFLFLIMALGIVSVQAQVGVRVITDAQTGRSYQFDNNVANPKSIGETTGDAVVVWNISETYATGGEIYISNEMDGDRKIVNNWSLNDRRIEAYLNESSEPVWEVAVGYDYGYLSSSKDCELMLVIDNPNAVAIDGAGNILNTISIGENNACGVVRPDGNGYYVSVRNGAGDTDVSYYIKGATTAEWTITLTGSVVAMNVSEFNSRLLVAMSEPRKVIYVLDGEEGDIIQDDFYYYNNSPTQSPAVSADGDYIAYADFSGKGTLKKWNGEKYETVWSVSLSCPGESSTWGAGQAISPDGKYIAFGTLGFISSGYQGAIFLFNNYSSTSEWLYTDCGDEVKYISFNEDGSLFACAGMGAIGNVTSDMWVFRPQSNEPYMELNTPGSMNTCTFSPDGKYVVVTGKSVHDREMGWGGNAYLVKTEVENVGALAGTTNVGNAIVTVNELDEYYIRTNADGTFSMRFIQEGTYSVTIEAIGYESVTLQNVVINGGETATIETSLTPSGLPVTGLYATQGESPVCVSLVWDECQDCQGYAVYRKETQDAPFDNPIATCSTAEFSDYTAIPTCEYYYAVTAILNGNAETPLSNIAVGWASTSFIVTEAEVYEGTVPTVDGQKNAGEWDDAFVFDISDFTGKTNEIEQAGSVLAYIKMNGNKIYFAVEVFSDEILDAEDCVALYWDDNCDRQYPVKNESNPDDSEGNYWMKYTGSGTSMTYRPLYKGGSVGTTINVPDAELEFGMVDGHVFVEFALEIGDETYNITPADNRSGMYMYYRSAGSDYMAYWPYNNNDTFDPVDYNTVIFNASHNAPLAPQNLRVDLGYSESFGTLLWDAVECNNFDHYVVNVNGEETACYGTSLMFRYELSTTYNVYITTFDHSGLQSPASETLTFTTGAMSVDESDIRQFAVYPNPADSYLTVSGWDICQIEILNIAGQIVGKYEVGGDIVILPVGNLESGIYFVRINGVLAEKVIIE